MSNRHQLHSVENANRRARAGGDRLVNVSEEYSEYTSHDIGDRATVIPIRPFEFVVPHRLDSFDYDIEHCNDPANILGAVIEGNIPVVTSQDPYSLLAAFNKRSNTIKEGAEFKIGKTELNQALNLINNLPNLFDPWIENEEDRARWLAKFDPAKKARMEAAWLHISDVDKRDIRNKTLMVKIETLLKREDPNWAPRVIYIGSDAHNALTGPAMMVAMERLVELLDTDNGGVKLGPADVRFAYKKDDTYLCEHLHVDPKCNVTVEGDFSANDREQVKEVGHDIIDAVLRKLNFDSYTRLWMIESNEEYNVYGFAAGIKATLKYQLPTGTTATTFRNSAFNAVMFAVAMSQQKVTNARCVILGDDIAAVLQQMISIKEWQNCVSRFQMKLKGQMHRELNGALTFLSRRLVANTPIPCLVPKIGKMLARFNVRACKNPAVTDDMFMAGKALAHAFEFRHAPQMAHLFLKRFEYHKRQCMMSDDQDIEHDSWFLKISGMTTPEQIKKAVLCCPVRITDNDWIDWVADTYLMGWDDLEPICIEVITGTAYKVIETAFFAELEIDF